MFGVADEKVRDNRAVRCAPSRGVDHRLASIDPNRVRGRANDVRQRPHIVPRTAPDAEHAFAWAEREQVVRATLGGTKEFHRVRVVHVNLRTSRCRTVIAQVWQTWAVTNGRGLWASVNLSPWRIAPLLECRAAVRRVVRLVRLANLVVRIGCRRNRARPSRARTLHCDRDGRGAPPSYGAADTAHVHVVV